MDCERFESLIGLYVEGDLAADEQRRVEAHLGACAACAELAEGLAESQAAVRSLRDEDVDDAVLAQVRRRVMTETSERKRSWWPWAYALATMVLAIGFWPRPPIPPPPDAPVLRLPAPQVAKSLPPPAPKPNEPLLVKMFTDDPDVVIYWIIDRKNGDSI